MGASFLKAPKTEKYVEDGENRKFRYGVANMQGWRAEMEDAHVVKLADDGADNGVTFIGVFDGHCGSEVAQFCAEHWIGCVESAESYPSDMKKAMCKSFFTLDDMLLDPSRSADFLNSLEARRRLEARKRSRDSRDDLEREVRARMDDASVKGSLSRDEALAIAEIMSEIEKKQETEKRRITEAGSTAICAALKDDKLYVANAGDSRAVLCRKNGIAFPLSIDHKPNNLVEYDRITNAGGWVYDGRVNGQLALSRAIGDFDFKRNQQIPAEKQAVTCDPEVSVVELADDDEFVILACDGVWDVVSNEEAVQFIREGLKTEKKISSVISKLLDHCLAETASGTMLGTDNMTCAVLLLA